MRKRNLALVGLAGAGATVGFKKLRERKVFQEWKQKLAAWADNLRKRIGRR